MSLPTVAVITTWPNVAPEEIEAQVTRPIEQAVSSAPNLYQVSSSTTEGSSSVRIQFQWGTDIGQAAVDVLQLVERATQSFPSDPTLQTPLVFKFDPTQLPILIFGVSGESDPVKLRTLLDNQISPMIESANGVASAIGHRRAAARHHRRCRPGSPARARPLARRRDAAHRAGEPQPARRASPSRGTPSTPSAAWAGSPAPRRSRSIPLGSFNGQIVSLWATWPRCATRTRRRGSTPASTASPSAGIIVSKQSGANTVDTAKPVFEKLERVKQLYPNLKFGVAYDQSQFISDSVNDVKVSALIGGVLAILILLFFLRNIRSTLVVALSIPTSIISTFALLYLCGFTLNTMSLGGLALATGLIVDDAVVVLENIFRHIERDKQDRDRGRRRAAPTRSCPRSSPPPGPSWSSSCRCC